ncbi:hypothetical protein E2C01_094084 [Portunus trituberculatus]|uniref:Uncharacterized protein n=1 Tax=Portunus trituberculatus TaxID=210409 RepID=A0A5B7K261_PORTR|nr:hypothetical protein [Portunus trituberculatus]
MNRCKKNRTSLIWSASQHHLHTSNCYPPICRPFRSAPIAFPSTTASTSPFKPGLSTTPQPITQEIRCTMKRNQAYVIQSSASCLPIAKNTKRKKKNKEEREKKKNNHFFLFTYKKSI